MINVKSFIAGLASKGCGEDLEYDADFLALSQKITGGEESQYGEHVYVPEPIDWIAVEALCLKLFERTHDLRVGVCLARAWLERSGLDGFANGLQVLAFLLRERWDTVHPQLSVTEQFDPLVRFNTLAELTVPSTVIATLRREPLARTDTQEVLSCADLALIAVGTESQERTGCLARLGRLIEPQCSTELMRSLGVLNRLEGLLVEIGQCLDDHTGLCAVSPLQPISRLLQQWLRVVEGRLRDTAQGLSLVSDPSPNAVIGRDAVPAQVIGGGECRSRDDVLRALDAIEAYYHHHEPSSPVPMLVRRVRKLAGMEFMEIIAELVPSSINELRILGGLQDS
ncbi:type VI secretion system protein ImpA [Pseudomonas sp. SJZ080]|uniref:type VI secretion system protein TssA n=1 Tax=Pseudomonas sp. SJZ080 TaxID=2572888 RepID=UPI0011990E16|nr:type VI secretion system protein TssA [Pseudomonas sp. SJZ080]TWC46131.1 type VI secretion system protein ImpA [Pseudomonas sp. SJZ080]